jgi:hypothetical protein
MRPPTRLRQGEAAGRGSGRFGAAGPRSNGRGQGREPAEQTSGEPKNCPRLGPP